MADCSYSRCVQERRNIRRELQRWTKNMVYIVGLERVAEELMGRRKWKLYQESKCRNYLNNNVDKIKRVAEESNESSEEAIIDDRLKDWTPESNCYFCVDGKLDSEPSQHGALSPRPSDSETSDSPSDTEAPPTLTPSALNMTTIESVTSMAGALAAVAALSGGGNPAAAANNAPAPFLPIYPGPNLFNHMYINVARNFPNVAAAAAAAAAAASSAEAMNKPPHQLQSGEQPLDLSAKPGGSLHDGKIPPSIRLPTLDTKHIFKAKPRMSAVAGRRTYTEDELQAALRDIQSGKLGTRRAAVIYGIPRSTLRNKVYKLAMERERETHLNPSIVHKMDDDEGMDDDKELSGAEEEKEVEKALQEPLLSMADILRFSNMDTPEALRALLQKGKEGQGNPWAGVEHSSVGHYMQMLLASGGLLQKGEADFNPIVPELVRRMIVEDQQMLVNGDNEKVMRPSPSNSAVSMDKIKTESPDADDDTPSNVILKIPSFKPTTSKNGCDLYRPAAETRSVVSPPVTSESGSPPIMPGKAMMSLREVIAKSISQKFQSSPEPMKMHPGVEMDYKRVGEFTPPLGGMSVIKNHQDMVSRSYAPPSQKPPHHHQQQHQQHQQPTNNNSTTTGGKGTRPKRGKYRNYDRDSLVEAVRAVQRGEMSVHRAGSYYGVPHSTLEYKVKERHLMRPRKRDPKPNPVDEKIASLKSQDSRQAAMNDKNRPSLKPPQKFPPTSPNGMKIPPIFDPNMSAPLGYTPPPFPFWPHPGFHHLPLDYARNPSTSAFPPSPEQFFAASQMMQRLQEDASRSIPQVAPPALPKNTRQIAESLLDSTGANGSFLDGIIRSSLESGVPSADDKAKREDKNPAPENMSNKALLDQLCRNSRLTPLSKGPVTSETNSSGDESYMRSGSPENHHHIQTIELSNDSNDSAEGNKNGGQDAEDVPHPRIYVKQQFQELTKPENLKPEVLVRMPSMNGCETQAGSASDTPDMEQD